MGKMLVIGFLWCGAGLFAAQDDVCRFNIGGYTMDIFCETAAKSSLLKAMMQETSPVKDRDGRLFINQTQEYGRMVHQFLCNGTLPVNTPVDSALDIAQIFGLDGIYPLYSYEPIA